MNKYQSECPASTGRTHIRTGLFGRYILINNAGVGTYGRFEEIDTEREQEEIMLNTAALVDLTHSLLPDMLRRENGVIVNVASIAVFMPCAYSTVHGATKAFVLSFSEVLWAETRGRGVRVLALCPGATETGFFDAVVSEEMGAGQNLSLSTSTWMRNESRLH